MPELRRDPIVGRWVIIATERARRLRHWPAALVAAERARVEGACRAEPVPRAQDRGRPRPAGGGDLRPDERDRRARGDHRDARSRPDAQGPHARRAHRGPLRLQGSDPRPPERHAVPVRPRVQEPRPPRRRVARPRPLAAHRAAGRPAAGERGDRGVEAPLRAEGALHLLRRGGAGAARPEPAHPRERRVRGVRAVRAAEPVRDLDRAEAPRVELRGGAEGAARAARRGARHDGAPPRARARRPGLQLHHPLQPGPRRVVAELPLARRDHAGAQPGGGVRVGLRVPHQPGAAGGGGRVPPQGRALTVGGPRLAMELLFVASEVAPWSKTGGLGDVSGALPRALAARGHTVAVVSPRYGSIDALAAGFTRRDSAVRVRGEATALWVKKGRPTQYLLEHERLFGSRRGIYGEGGADYGDNAERFTWFARAALA